MSAVKGTGFRKGHTVHQEVTRKAVNCRHLSTAQKFSLLLPQTMHSPLKATAPRACQQRPARSSAARVMASYKVYVKGDPKTNTLLDCPFCHRVLLTLETKHIPYQNEYIDFANKPAWLQDRSGGKVPVINRDGFWLPDSDEIVKYLEQQHPQPSMATAVPAEVSANFFPLFKGWLFAEPGEEEEKRAAFLGVFGRVNDHLSKHEGSFFGGQQLDATDAALAPKLYHAIVALGHYRGFTLEGFGPVAQYMEAMQQLPAWKACDYGPEAIIKGWSHKH